LIWYDKLLQPHQLHCYPILNKSQNKRFRYITSYTSILISFFELFTFHLTTMTAIKWTIVENLLLSIEVVHINRVVSLSSISLIVLSHSAIQEIGVVVSEQRKQQLLRLHLKSLLYRSLLVYLFLKFTFELCLLIEN